MTIRICHNKFNKILGKIWTVIIDTMEIGVHVTGLIGVYLILTGETVVFIPFVIGGFLGLLLSWFRISDKESVYQRLNEKLKLFGWREDC